MMFLFEINYVLQQKEIPKQNTVSSEYHEFLNLFSKKEAKELPLHRPYNHKNPLQPGTEPSFGPLYGISKPEFETLKEYIDEISNKGFIWDSSSPAKALILFVKKKTCRKPATICRLLRTHCHPSRKPITPTFHSASSSQAQKRSVVFQARHIRHL